VVRRLGTTRRVTVAAPAYLAKFGHPSSPDDIVNHRPRDFLLPPISQRLAWEFGSDAEKREMQFSGRFAFNDGLARVEAAAAGLGIAQTLEFVARPFLSDGRLVRLFQHLESEAPPISILYAPTNRLPARTRAFIDFAASVVKDACGSPHQRYALFIASGGYLSPAAAPTGTRRSIAAISSGERSISSARILSSTFLTCFVPGIAMTFCPWRITQAMASSDIEHPLTVANRDRRSTRARFLFKFAGSKRGNARRASAPSFRGSEPASRPAARGAYPTNTISVPWIAFSVSSPSARYRMEYSFWIAALRITR